MDNKINAGALKYKVFTVKRQGVNRDPDMPAVPDDLKWVVNTATLIYGQKDAVLVDTFLTLEQSQFLVESVAATGKDLKYIYITHGHGDHFFGLQMILDKFPKAKAITTRAIVNDIDEAVKPEMMDGFWNKLFPGQIPGKIALPQAMDGDRFDLEGNTIQVVETGFTDTHHSTSIYVPSIGLVVAGDVVYNDIHPFLAETTKQTRREWIAALGTLEALHPKAVVAGHKNPERDDSPDNVAETKNYLENFERLNSESSSAKELFEKMFALYPQRANPGSLWGAVTNAKNNSKMKKKSYGGTQEHFLSLETLSIVKDGGVLFVDIDAPPMNLMGPELIRDLIALIQKAEADTDIQVLVFRSADPEFFISHVDVTKRKENREAVIKLNGEPSIGELLRYLSVSRLISIAQIEGRVRGVGSEFVLACDMRFAARETAIFGQFEPVFGVIPGAGAAQHLTRLMGRGRALEVMLSAEDYNADLAERYGWINRALPADEVGDFVAVLAQRIALFPASGRAAVKERVNAIALASREDFSRDTQLFYEGVQNQDYQDWMDAALKHGFQNREVELNLGRMLGNLAKKIKSLLTFILLAGALSMLGKVSYAQPESSVEPVSKETIRPFKVHASNKDLTNLKRRLLEARLPDKETVTDQSQGVQLATMQKLIHYWATGYDWHKAEARLNALPQFVTKIDGLDIYFIHVRSKEKNALPVIITHGWPGSIFEELKLIRPLTDPVAYGGRPEDAFDVVIPSMPGYGFSEKPNTPGWNTDRIARAWDTLMKRLGYTHYVSQGGDWGAKVSEAMAHLAPQGLLGVHMNLLLTFPPEVNKAIASGEPAPENFSEEEKQAYNQRKTLSPIAYLIEQAKRPQTIGYSLAESPVGLAAWLLDHDPHTYEQLARAFNEHPDGDLTRDDFLDNITLYWLTNTGASAARLYWENARIVYKGEVSVPAAFTVFPGELWHAPRSWVERAFKNLIYYHEVDQGGHFADWERPQLFAEEVRAAFRSLR